MSDKQEELTVKEMVEDTEILAGIEQFRTMISSYQAREILQTKRYAVQREFYELEKTIEIFQSQLEALLQQSEIWEAGS